MKTITKESLKEGMKVIFVGEMKALDKDTIGTISSIHDGWCSVIYPQNLGTNKVYAHSCDFTKMKIVED